MDKELYIELEDNEWPYKYTSHDRVVTRAIVYDSEGYFYFMRANRDDDFGKSVLIETSGGGVEPGEGLEEGLLRELKEELGAEVEIIKKIGVVSDYYNLINRHNINNYYLCKLKERGNNHLTKDEIEHFHLTILKLKYEEAALEYEKCSDSKLGRLIKNRELPILNRAYELIKENQ